MSSRFVPVAVNLYEVRRADDAGGELFRSVQRQKDQYQGIWIVSPEGKVLAGHHDIKDRQRWPEEVLQTMDAALAAFGPVPARRVGGTNPLPHRGLGARPDGARVLALYTRYVSRRTRPDGPAVIDEVVLDAEGFSALLPPKLEPGDEWTVPQDVVRTFSRALSPTSDQSTMPDPRDVTHGALTGRVTSVESGIAKITYAGHLEAAHESEGRTCRGKAAIHGKATYDLARSCALRLTLVFEGEFRHFPPYDTPRRTGAVAEWRADDEGDR